MASRNQRQVSSTRSRPAEPRSNLWRRLFSWTKPSQPGRQSNSTNAWFQLKKRTLSSKNYQPSQWNSLDLEGVGVFPVSINLISTFERKYGQVRSMVAGPDGLLYTGSCSRNIRFWDKGNAYWGFSAWNGPIYALLLDPQSRVFSAHYDGTIRVWQRNAAELTTYNHVTSLPTRKGRFVSMLWRINCRIAALYWHDFPVSCLCFSEDMRFLYSGSWDHTMKIWSLQDFRLIESIGWHTERVSAVAAGSNGLVFSGSADGSIIMWRRVGGRNGKDPKHTFAQTLLNVNSSVNAILLKSTETGNGTLYAGLSDGRVLFWMEAVNWGPHEVLSYHRAEVSCVAGSPGPLVFSGALDGRVCVWKKVLGSGHTLLMVLMAHEGPVNCLATDKDWEEHGDGPCRCILYSGSEDKTLKTWRVADASLDISRCGL